MAERISGHFSRPVIRPETHSVAATPPTLQGAWAAAQIDLNVTSAKRAVSSCRSHRQEEASMSTTRIPKAKLTGPHGYVVKRFCRKLLGGVPEPAEVMWHNRRVLTSVMGFGGKV
jgi:hypothetical protein